MKPATAYKLKIRDDDKKKSGRLCNIFQVDRQRSHMKGLKSDNIELYHIKKSKW